MLAETYRNAQGERRYRIPHLASVWRTLIEQPHVTGMLATRVDLAIATNHWDEVVTLEASADEASAISYWLHRFGLAGI